MTIRARVVQAWQRLTPRHRQIIRHKSRKSGVAVCRFRCKIILGLGQGKTPTQMAAGGLGSRSQIYRVAQLFLDEGLSGMADKREQNGGPSRWSEEAESVLCKALEHSPDELGYLAVNWTVPLLREYIEKEWGQKPSDLQVRRELCRLDYVWKRPGLDLHGAKSPRVRRRLRLIRKKVRDLPVGCAKLFEDETELHLFPPLRAGWFKRGKPAKVPISGWNAKRAVFGTIDVETGRRIFIVRAGICAPDFHEILQLIHEAYGNRKVALLLDKASRHTAHASAELAAELGVQLIWLPTRSKNINPMDRLWRWGKEKICANRQHPDIDSQASMFIEYMQSLSPQEALRKAGMLSGRFWLQR
jgi:transposase